MDELWLSLSSTVSVIALYCSSGPYFSNSIQLFLTLLEVALRKLFLLA